MLFYEKLKKSQQNKASRNAGGSLGQGTGTHSRTHSNTNIQNCVAEELNRYFELLDGQPPSDLYRMVMSQVEHTLIAHVLEECGNNQSRAAEYLGISRGTLRNKLTDQGLI